MTDTPSTGKPDTGDPDSKPVRLSPPPKVGKVGADGADDAVARRARADRSLVYWLTGLVFLVLAATAFAVFVFLPDWVEERDSAAGRAAVTGQQGDTGATATSADPHPVEPGEPAREAPLVEAQQSPVSEPRRPPAVDPKPIPEEAERQTPNIRPTPPAAAPPAAPGPVAPGPAADPSATAFTEAMTEGLARLDQGELAQAQTAFERARSIRPAAEEARDGLARVEAERQLLAIADHRERAAAHEEQERWGEAAAEYAAVLALDASIRFAQEGREHSAARQDLSDRLDSHNAHPDRLATDQVLEDARDALAEAREIDAPGPALTRQIERLTAQIAVAETPIPVVLLSDGETDLLVFRVGRLGTFERHRLELRPGAYTVVGTRDGYRDVRRTLQVAPGKGEITLTVRCKEKI